MSHFPNFEHLTAQFNSKVTKKLLSKLTALIREAAKSPLIAVERHTAQVEEFIDKTIMNCALITVRRKA